MKVRLALQGVNEWFDEYMAKEELTPGQVHIITTKLSLYDEIGYNMLW